MITIRDYGAYGHGTITGEALADASLAVAGYGFGRIVQAVSRTATATAGGAVQNVPRQAHHVPNASMPNPSAGRLTGNLNGLTPGERLVVNDLLRQGNNVEVIPPSNAQGTGSPDFRVNGVRTELKTLQGTSPDTPVTRITYAFRRQNAEAVILDARQSPLTNAQLEAAIPRARGAMGGTLPGYVEIWTQQGVIHGGR